MKKTLVGTIRERRGEKHNLYLEDFTPLSNGDEEYDFLKLSRLISYEKFEKGEWENGFNDDKFYEEMAKSWGEENLGNFFSVPNLNLVIIPGAQGIFPAKLETMEW